MHPKNPPPYSPDRRTALVFCGTGAHGAYQAGVLRALQEGGVRIDVVAGQGIGAATAALAAIDGGARLWEADGIWRGLRTSRMYRWKWPLLVSGWVFAALGVPVVGAAILAAIDRPVARAATIGSGLLYLAILGVLFGAVKLAQARSPERRSRGAWWWRLAGAPVDVERARSVVVDTIWQLIRGAAPLEKPAPPALGRRYSDVLGESLGQPGFRELVMVVHDLDTRSDLVAALLRDPYRREFIAGRSGRERQAEAIDLAGVGRDHAIDVVFGALSPPLGADPHLARFAADSFWRGETHRLVDRPGAVARLLEELSAAGVSQAIVVSAVAMAAVPHRLMSTALDFRTRLGEALAAAEAASLRDAVEQARLRFDAIFVVCPAHNPVGPFDLAGAYDEASDRRQPLSELMERGYEDAYRQFIEPVVGASGEQLAQGSQR